MNFEYELNAEVYFLKIRFTDSSIIGTVKKGIVIDRYNNPRYYKIDCEGSILALPPNELFNSIEELDRHCWEN
jgi:hypothetical protein